jgi:hypothetical protein
VGWFADVSENVAVSIFKINDGLAPMFIFPVHNVVRNSLSDWICHILFHVFYGDSFVLKHPVKESV